MCFRFMARAIYAKKSQLENGKCVQNTISQEAEMTKQGGIQTACGEVFATSGYANSKKMLFHPYSHQFAKKTNQNTKKRL